MKSWREFAGRPQLREGLQAYRDGAGFVLHDPRRVALAPLNLVEAELQLADQLRGRHTPRELLAHLESSLPPGTDCEQFLNSILDRLESNLYLEGEALETDLRSTVRRSSCMGCYAETPELIHTQLDALMPTSPIQPTTPGRVRAILAPHMDYARGNLTYGYSYQALRNTDARLFIIIGTSHYSPSRFSLTYKHFTTPLGTVTTDARLVKQIADAVGPSVFADRYAHLPEHSIELEVVWLQHLFAGQPIRIVPILVGSFQDFVQTGTDPTTDVQVSKMIAAIAHAEASAGEPVCTIISGDLAHIGPKFGDAKPVNDSQLVWSRRGDEKLLSALRAADAEAYHAAIVAEGDARRICGFPPTYVALNALCPARGEVLHYQQYVHPQGDESVSFAAAAWFDFT